MNVSGPLADTQKMNVVSLFGNSDLVLSTPENDPLDMLLAEADLPDVEVSSVTASTRTVVSEFSFPDQSMHLLDLQLNQLKQRIERIKFYLGDIDDLLPR